MNPDRTLTKAELAELLFQQVGLNKREAKDIVDAFFDEIREVIDAHGGLFTIYDTIDLQLARKPE